jgi:hypothetical protein
MAEIYSQQRHLHETTICRKSNLFQISPNHFQIALQNAAWKALPKELQMEARRKDERYPFSVIGMQTKPMEQFPPPNIDIKTVSENISKFKKKKKVNEEESDSGYSLS